MSPPPTWKPARRRSSPRSASARSPRASRPRSPAANASARPAADEPTGNLDRANGDKVFADFRRVAREQGAAVVLVTHDEPAAEAADRVLRMADGRLG